VLNWSSSAIKKKQLAHCFQISSNFIQCLRTLISRQQVGPSRISEIRPIFSLEVLQRVDFRGHVAALADAAAGRQRSQLHRRPQSRLSSVEKSSRAVRRKRTSRVFKLKLAGRAKPLEKSCGLGRPMKKESRVSAQHAS